MKTKLRRPRIKGHFRRRTKPGAAPGLVAPDPRAPQPIIQAILYEPQHHEARKIDDLDEIPALLKRGLVVWINVDGLGDADVIRRLGKIFDIHPLALEDVVNVHQRPKVEDYGELLFMVARMPAWSERLETEQLSLFLGDNFVVSFQERPGDCFQPLRERLRKSKSRVRREGADYLAYCLLDAVVDAYFPVLERYGEQLDALDEAVAARPSHELIVGVHQLRGGLQQIRREIWPLREVFNFVVREEHPLVRRETRIYLRDCYDHTVQIMDLIETGREMCSDLRDFYLSAVNTRMSEVMKVLTLIATIFIPLSFVAGVYGMNFDADASRWNMPELEWRYGYPYSLALMAAIAFGQLFFFWRRGWLGRF